MFKTTPKHFCQHFPTCPQKVTSTGLVTFRETYSSPPSFVNHDAGWASCCAASLILLGCFEAVNNRPPPQKKRNCPFQETYPSKCPMHTSCPNNDSCVINNNIMIILCAYAKRRMQIKHLWSTSPVGKVGMHIIRTPCVISLSMGIAVWTLRMRIRIAKRLVAGHVHQNSIRYSSSAEERLHNCTPSLPPSLPPRPCPRRFILAARQGMQWGIPA